MPEATRAPSPIDVPLGDIRAAADRIAGLVHRTPVLSSTTAGRLDPGRDRRRVARRARCTSRPSISRRPARSRPAASPTGSRRSTPEARERGVITLSAGNAGQAYAWAGRAAGVPVTVVMPAGAVRSKVDACRGYGARVVLHGAHVGDTFAEMERIRDAEGLTFVHPVRRPGRHRRQRDRRPRAPRGPARRRRRWSSASAAEG